jgi:hypothetical protein
MITGIISLSTGNVQDSGAVIAYRAAAPNGKYNYSTSEYSKVASRYDFQLPLSISSSGT